MWDLLNLQPEPPLLPTGRQAAVLIPLFEDEAGEVRAVVIKRPLSMPTHGGHLGFPGGRDGPDDHGPVETALREAREEVGIDPLSVEILGFLTSVDTVESGIHVAPVVGRLAGVPNLIPCDREVEEIFLPKLSYLADPRIWSKREHRSLVVWSAPVSGESLWGASAKMVREMLRLIS